MGQSDGTPEKATPSTLQSTLLLQVHLDNVPYKTPLTEFFAIHAADPDRRKYLYSEIPTYFVWDVDHQQWRGRKKGTVVGKLESVLPSEGERYYLYLLLSHVPGPTSFNDLLSYEENQYSSFKEAAVKRGLVED